MTDKNAGSALDQRSKEYDIDIEMSGEPEEEQFSKGESTATWQKNII
jgi:hypothetical protein